MLSVAQAEHNPVNSKSLRGGRSRILQPNRRLSSMIPLDGQIKPRNIKPDSGSKCFGDGLLRCKARSVTRPRHPQPRAIGSLLVREDTRQKTIAMLLDHSLDPRDLNDVYPGPDDNHGGSFPSLRSDAPALSL